LEERGEAEEKKKACLHFGELKKKSQNRAQKTKTTDGGKEEIYGRHKKQSNGKKSDIYKIQT